MADLNETLKGQVIDSTSGLPLVGATIMLDNTPIGVTDNQGNFNINTLVEGQSLIVSYVGYTSAEYPIDQVNSLAQIALDPSGAASLLPAVTVTPTSQQLVTASAQPAVWLPLAIAGGAIALLSMKKKKVGAIDTKTILIGGGVALAAYLIFSKISTPAPAPVVPVYNPAYLQSAAVNAGNPVAQDITAGAGAASSLITAISML